MYGDKGAACSTAARKRISRTSPWAAARPVRARDSSEAQRIKLATELLLRQLHRLVDAGKTVALVEHDLDAIATADWVIDLDPGGGDAGGQVVATGMPADIAKAEGSATAPYLARRLERT